MSISTLNDVVAALASASAQPLGINKASVANLTAGAFASLWRATGTPTQGAIPGAAAVCDNAVTGALTYTNPVSGKAGYLGRAFINAANGGTGLIVLDRLAHMGGLSGTVTTAQTAGVDCSVSTSNLVARRGKSDYSEIQWFLEWYTDTGSTAVTATVTYTNGAGVSGQTCTVSLAATMRASRLVPIVTTNGEAIQSIQSVTLSASTGTAGSFGVTAARAVTELTASSSNWTTPTDWAALGLPKVEDSSCLMLACIPTATSSGIIIGGIKFIQG